MAPAKVAHRRALGMVDCPFCHAEFNVRGFTNHLRACQSHHEELLHAAGLEEAALEREDGRSHTYLY